MLPFIWSYLIVKRRIQYLRNFNKIVQLSFLYNKSIVRFFHENEVNDEHLRILKFAKKIELSVLNKVTDDGLAFLSQAEEVKLSFLNKVTNEGLCHLQNIKKIELRRLENVKC